MTIPSCLNNGLRAVSLNGKQLNPMQCERSSPRLRFTAMPQPSLSLPELHTSSDFSGLRSVATCQLKGFSEDLVTRRAFEWRYRWMMASLLPIVIASVWILGHRHGQFAAFVERLLPQPGWDLLSVVSLGVIFASLVLLFGAAIHSINAVPVSRVSGHRMLRFEREDAPTGSELIYIDPESRTYFCRVVQNRR